LVATFFGFDILYTTSLPRSNQEHTESADLRHSESGANPESGLAGGRIRI